MLNDTTERFASARRFFRDNLQPTVVSAASGIRGRWLWSVLLVLVFSLGLTSGVKAQFNGDVASEINVQINVFPSARSRTESFSFSLEVIEGGEDLFVLGPFPVQADSIQGEFVLTGPNFIVFEPFFEVSSNIVTRLYEGTISYTAPENWAPGSTERVIYEITDDIFNFIDLVVTVTMLPDPQTDLSGLTPAQQTLVGVLDNACAAIEQIPEAQRTDAQKDLADTCDRVRQSENPGALLDGLAPEEVAAQGRASLTTIGQQMGNVTRRMQLLRQGRTGGFDVSGLSLNLDGQVIPVALLAEALGQSLGGSAGDLADSGRLGWYISGSGIRGSRSATDLEPGSDYRSFGLTAGADYRFSANTFAGAALGLTRSDNDFKDDSGGVDVDGYSLSLYATHFTPRQFYVDGVLVVGRNKFDTVRTVFAGPGGQKALSKPKGNELGLGLSGGYDFVQGARTVSLLAGVDYLRSRIDAFEERSSDPGAPGAGSLLAIDRQTVDSLTTELAVQWSHAYPWRGGVLLPTARFGVEYEHRDDSRSINARFIHDPSETHFAVFTDDPDRTYFNIGAGMSAQFTHGRAAYIFFETVQGRSGVREQRVDAGVRFEF